jgi:ATP-binding protein involved in chromosome partitioning
MGSQIQAITEDQVRTTLSSIIDPDLGRDIVSLGFVQDIEIDREKVSVTIELTTPACPVKDQMQADAERLIRELGAAEVEVRMTAQVVGDQNRKKNAIMPNVANTIAIASGKGGVGKSTVAANLAVALARDGSRVGYLDADIYGPSAPLMFGLTDARPDMYETPDGERKLVPLQAHGVKVMSIGFLMDPDQAVIWRGPMAAGAMRQFMTDVDWGELDYLIFDMPPGTGDIQLTLSQTLPLTGAVIVTTPQELALADARKGLRMFQKVEVPVLGIIENMSHFVAPDTGVEYDIFSRGGARKASDQMSVPFLGEIPLTIETRIAADEGMPIVLRNPDSPQAEAFTIVARNVAAAVSTLNMSGTQKQPEIVI